MSCGRWSAADEAVPYAGYTATLPAPPRPPRLAALLSEARDLGLSSSFYDNEYQKREVHHFSCWRLRWCALCLVIAVVLQASAVGSTLQAYFLGDSASARAPGAGADVFFASALLALLIVALWSLLSQLLLWSDAAVMKARASHHAARSHHT